MVKETEKFSILSWGSRQKYLLTRVVLLSSDMSLSGVCVLSGKGECRGGKTGGKRHSTHSK